MWHFLFWQCSILTGTLRTFQSGVFACRDWERKKSSHHWLRCCCRAEETWPVAHQVWEDLTLLLRHRITLLSFWWKNGWVTKLCSSRYLPQMYCTIKSAPLIPYSHPSSFGVSWPVETSFFSLLAHFRSSQSRERSLFLLGEKGENEERGQQVDTTSSFSSSFSFRAMSAISFAHDFFSSPHPSPLS